MTRSAQSLRAVPGGAQSAPPTPSMAQAGGDNQVGLETSTTPSFTGYQPYQPSEDHTSEEGDPSSVSQWTPSGTTSAPRGAGVVFGGGSTTEGSLTLSPDSPQHMGVCELEAVVEEGTGQTAPPGACPPLPAFSQDPQ